MLHFHEPIIDYFVKREKRFFAYMENSIAHCVNTGKMADILIPGSKCILSTKDSGKLKYTWEAIFIDTSCCGNGVWVGTNTMNPNKLVEQILPELFPNEIFKREVTFGHYRADFANDKKIIEVKHVHWKQGEIAFFPDCISERGAKQVTILSELTSKYDCYIIYIIQRDDISKFGVADFIDVNYGHATKIASKNGVKSLAFSCHINEKFIKIHKSVDLIY